MPQKLTTDSVSEFLTKRPFSVIHIDASWDGYRKAVSDRTEKLESSLQDVSFGYLDCDEEQAYAVEIKLVNIPCVAYYTGTTLVAKVIGIRQDILRNLDMVRNGQIPDSSNTLSRG
jgi:hypothetical protein